MYYPYEQCGCCIELTAEELTTENILRHTDGSVSIMGDCAACVDEKRANGELIDIRHLGHLTYPNLDHTVILSGLGDNAMIPNLPYTAVDDCSTYESTTSTVYPANVNSITTTTSVRPIYTMGSSKPVWVAGDRSTTTTQW